MCTGTSSGASICRGANCGGTCETSSNTHHASCSASCTYECYFNCNFGCTTAICTLAGSACGTNCHNGCSEASCIDLCYKICASWVENKTGIACASSCSATGRNIFYYVVLNISLKLLGVIIWVEKEKFLKNQKV